MRSIRFALALLIALGPQLSAQERPAELLIRVDDIGMNHSVNAALARIAETGMPLSASVMFACPWYQEAVEILRRNPQISVGVHLTLNSEWSGYRWGPVLGKESVPSLVDSVGYFHPSTSAFLSSGYDPGEVERELNAQIERAMSTGLRIDYVDHHMGTAVARPELREIVERVAREHGLGIPRYFGEAYETMFGVAIEEKRSAFLSYVSSLVPGSLNLVVIHAAASSPEIDVLVDMNNTRQNTATGEPLMSRHRQAELETLLSSDFARLRASGTVSLINYGQLIARVGLSSMRRR